MSLRLWDGVCMLLIYLVEELVNCMNEREI
jgi:hypothetical protein